MVLRYKKLLDPVRRLASSVRSHRKRHFRCSTISVLLLRILSRFLNVKNCSTELPLMGRTRLLSRPLASPEYPIRRQAPISRRDALSRAPEQGRTAAQQRLGLPDHPLDDPARGLDRAHQVGHLAGDHRGGVEVASVPGPGIPLQLARVAAQPLRVSPPAVRELVL